jgi:hypothetical protein
MHLNQSMGRTRAELLAGAVSWLEKNLGQFDPLMAGVQPDALRNKALAELAFLCDYMRRAKPSLEEHSRRMLSFVENVWRRSEYQDLIVRNPESLQLYVLTYNSLLRAGFEVSGAKRTIQSVINAGYATSVEAVPFRVMDFRHVLDGAELCHSLPSMNELLSRTMLAQRPPLHYLTTADIYCLTHTIFYLTDFGFASPAAIGLSDLIELREIVELLIGLSVRLQDWDLTSELLVCGHCLESAPTALKHIAWTALTAAQLEDGSVPAPKFEPHGTEGRRFPEQYAFEHNYHTTLVAALAAVLCKA